MDSDPRFADASAKGQLEHVVWHGKDAHYVNTEGSDYARYAAHIKNAPNSLKPKLSNSQFLNPDGSFKLVNGSQESTLVYHFMGEGHSEESAKRMENSILNAGTSGGAVLGWETRKGGMARAGGASNASFKASKNSDWSIPSKKLSMDEADRRTHEHYALAKTHRRISDAITADGGDAGLAKQHAIQAAKHIQFAQNLVIKHSLYNSSILNAETDNTCLPGTLNGLATASSKAADASEAAEASGTASDHFAAKNAHEAAGNLAARLGDTETASKHAAKASEHAGKGVAAYPKGQTDKPNAASIPPNRSPAGIGTTPPTPFGQ
jgi:hypothetical protein